jgi:multidrug efflux pump subunit AcrB
MPRLFFPAVLFLLAAARVFSQETPKDPTPAAPKLKELEDSLPPGYKIIVSGEQAKQVDGFKNLTVVMAISIAMIFLALAFQQALLDAGIVRLRPVMITVGATILALFPLALHGGPLWQPLCYAQIGGLGVATFITLLLVPVLYSIFVLDLKIVTWGKVEAPTGEKLSLEPKGGLT